MKRANFTNLSSPNLGLEAAGKRQQNTKSAAAIFSNAPLEKKGPWLCAWKDPLASIKAFSSCVRMGDIKGDGEARLLIAESSQKFLIYKGVNIESEFKLIEVPLAIALFYSEISKNREEFRFFLINFRFSSAEYRHRLRKRSVYL